MRNKKRIEILENLLYDLLRILHFERDPKDKEIILSLRSYMGDNLPHIRKKLDKNHTRTLTRHTEG